ncbi:MAG: hypothetical protein ACPKQO_09565 [Nitrososphaeraceae archaeon]
MKTQCSKCDVIEKSVASLGPPCGSCIGKDVMRKMKTYENS